MTVRTSPTVEDLARQLAKLEQQVGLLSALIATPEHYTVGEFARLVGLAPYTIREHARQGRIHATRRATGGGPYRPWVISRAELLRFQREGLLPDDEHQQKPRIGGCDRA